MFHIPSGLCLPVNLNNGRYEYNQDRSISDGRYPYFTVATPSCNLGYVLSDMLQNSKRCTYPYQHFQGNTVTCLGNGIELSHITQSTTMEFLHNF